MDTSASPINFQFKVEIVLASTNSICMIVQVNIKREQIKMYQKMKDLDSKLTAVFNKVDVIVTQNRDDEFDAAYFDDHNDKTVNKLGCKKMCIMPDWTGHI